MSKKTLLICIPEGTANPVTVQFSKFDALRVRDAKIINFTSKFTGPEVIGLKFSDGLSGEMMVASPSGTYYSPDTIWLPVLNSGLVVNDVIGAKMSHPIHLMGRGIIPQKLVVTRVFENSSGSYPESTTTVGIYIWIEVTLDE